MRTSPPSSPPDDPEHSAIRRDCRRKQRARASPFILGEPARAEQSADGDRRAEGLVGGRTFSMANSSSALTWISRAFSRASCEINATCRPQRHRWHARFGQHAGGRAGSAMSGLSDGQGEEGRRDESSLGLTILFISVWTSSSFSGRGFDIVESCVEARGRRGEGGRWSLRASRDEGTPWLARLLRPLPSELARPTRLFSTRPKPRQPQQSDIGPSQEHTYKRTTPPIALPPSSSRPRRR